MSGWWPDARHAEGGDGRGRARHLDDTWFSWYGGYDDHTPFYYRVHSPVILIEFDHHPGVAFDNEEPTRNHVHTVVRTPNGGDDGADLLRQHHEQFDHTQGPPDCLERHAMAGGGHSTVRHLRHGVVVGVADPAWTLGEVAAGWREHVDQPVVHRLDGRTGVHERGKG